MKARRRSHLDLLPKKCLLEHFVAGMPARSAAEILGARRNIAPLSYRKLREIIAEHNALEATFEGEVEVDEQGLGPVRP